jgi:hypothetical protein
VQLGRMIILAAVIPMEIWVHGDQWLGVGVTQEEREGLANQGPKIDTSTEKKIGGRAMPDKNKARWVTAVWAAVVTLPIMEEVIAGTNTKSPRDTRWRRQNPKGKCRRGAIETLRGRGDVISMKDDVFQVTGDNARTCVVPNPRNDGGGSDGQCGVMTSISG